MIQIRIDENLLLETHQLHRAQALFKIVDQNRAYLRQWLPWLDNSLTVSDTENFIKSVLKKQEEGSGLSFIILFKDSIVGTIAFNTINLEEKQASIGYWLASNNQGKGIITRCCQALINYGIKELHLKKFTISCAEKNTKSQAIAKRLGFKLQKVEEKKEWLYNHHVNHFVFFMDYED